MTRARAVAWWTVPSLVCLLIHWQGFTAWFRADDFAWLSNFDRIHSFHDLLVILFLPQAQGTIRPFSERAFFVVGYGLVGLDSLPFRIVIFATQFAALALFASVTVGMPGTKASAAPESSRISTASRGCSFALMGVRVIPAAHMPKNSSTISGRFSDMMAMRSPTTKSR